MLQRYCAWSAVLNVLLATGLWAQGPAPNVIYIMLDDLGPGEFSSYDNLQGLGQTSKISTPNIDQLATQGIRFTNAHSATALCAPTRAAVMAGTPIWQTNTRWGFGSASLRSGQQSVGDLMQAAGYRTALMGKGHLGGNIYQVGSDNTANKNFSNLANMDFDRPLKDGMKEHGFDYTFNMIAGIQARPYFFWENDLATDADANGNSTRITNANKSTLIRQWDANYDDGVTEISPGASGIGSVNWKTRDVPQTMLNKAVGFMNDSVANSPTQPFYLHYNSVAGHWPYVAPTDIQVDINGDGDTADPGEFHNVDGYNGTGPAPDDRGTESMQMVSVSDAEVGVLVSYLEQTDDPRNPGQKLIDNTMIIYTSDNGGIGPDYYNQFVTEGVDPPFDGDEWTVYGHDSTGGLRENKAYYTEGGHRVPFIVQWPGQVEAGAVRDQRISNVDLMGTLAGLTGQSLLDQGQGSHNLLPVITGVRDDSDPIRDNLIVDDTGGASDGVSRKLYYEDNWKLVLSTSSSSPTLYEVYDLNTDPGETTDLRNSPDPSVQQRITSMYVNHLVERNAVRAAPVFIGRNSTIDISQVSPYTDVDVEGTLEGNGQVNGNLDLNSHGTLRIVPGALTSQQTITVQQDVSLRAGAPTTNWNGQRNAVGLTNTEGLARTALEFDLTTLNVPVGATIVDAEIVFRVGFGWTLAQDDSPTLEIYSLTTDFDETTATWEFPWSTQGGDFDSLTPLAMGNDFNPDTVNGGDLISVAGSALTADLMASLADSQYQLLVRYDDTTEANGLVNALWLDSLQNGPQPPQLVVTYDLASILRSINVTGDYTQRDGSTLELTLGSSSNFDQLLVNGALELMGGDLDVLLEAGFNPGLGDVFDILDFSSVNGSFDSINLPALAADLAWSTKDLLTTGELLVISTADFDESGTVDENDLSLLRSSFGATGATFGDGDANSDGIVDGKDFLIWQRNLGVSITATQTTTASVPEPTSWLLAMVAGLGWCAAASRR